MVKPTCDPREAGGVGGGGRKGGGGGGVDVHDAGRPGQDSWEKLLSFRFHWLLSKVVRDSLKHGQLICSSVNHIGSQDALEMHCSWSSSLLYPICEFRWPSFST